MKLPDLCRKFPYHPGAFLVLYHPDCLLHEGHLDHPEKPARLFAALQGCFDRLSGSEKLSFQIASPASFSELELVHDRSYLRSLEACCLSDKSIFMSEDNYLSSHSLESILAAAGCSRRLGEWVAGGGQGGALIRPPGHHAGRNNAEGFCFVNHLALAVETIRQTHPQGRFLAVDFDVHYGNGISSIFQEDPQVYYFSQHGSPAHIYPYSGDEQERGSGAGEGFTRNITLPLDTDGESWRASLCSNLQEIAADFRPDFLLVSAGFDAHREDPFSLMQVEDQHYLQAARALKEVAQTHCDGRMGFVLEGGYSTTVLERLVPEFIEELLDA